MLWRGTIIQASTHEGATEMQTTTINRGVNKNGFAVRMQKRGSKFDVIYCTGFCWKYIAKSVSEQTAANIFHLELL